jgi:hypothetical protein
VANRNVLVGIFVLAGPILFTVGIFLVGSHRDRAVREVSFKCWNILEVQVKPSFLCATKALYKPLISVRDRRSPIQAARSKTKIECSLISTIRSPLPPVGKLR